MNSKYFILKNLEVKQKVVLLGIDFCQIFRWKSCPEIQELTSKYLSWSGTGILGTGTANLVPSASLVG